MSNDLKEIKKSLPGQGKLNCWEFQGCGRELGGKNVRSHGICPASLNTLLDGVHDGISAGRACWVIAGTLCGGRYQGSFVMKYKECGQCDFYHAVREEEGEHFLMTVDLLRMIEDRPA